jgi:hypothetical protein
VRVSLGIEGGIRYHTDLSQLEGASRKPGGVVTRTYARRHRDQDGWILAIVTESEGLYTVETVLLPHDGRALWFTLDGGYDTFADAQRVVDQYISRLGHKCADCEHWPLRWK